MPPATVQSIPDAAQFGVLVVNLGTPAAPTTGAVRRYLREFLSDPRVVEFPRLPWWLILNLVILRVRPRRSAAAYAEVWTDDGSPLLINSRAIADGIATRLAVPVELAMRYGEPTITGAIDRLLERGISRLVVLPLYPQYSATTTASVFDAVASKLRSLRRLPALSFIDGYHAEPGYIDALAKSVREFRGAHGSGDKLLMSFHGIPKKMTDDGDPYLEQCLATAHLLAESLGLGKNDWTISFQSRVGREEWLTPYTEDIVKELGREGLRRLDVVCPGFPADCLETLEEIAMQNGEFFEDAGGGELRYIPALNARDDHCAMLADLAHRRGSVE